MDVLFFINPKLSSQNQGEDNFVLEQLFDLWRAQYYLVCKLGAKLQSKNSDTKVNGVY